LIGERRHALPHVDMRSSGRLSAELLWIAAADSETMRMGIACGKSEGELSLPYGEFWRLRMPPTCSTRVASNVREKRKEKSFRDLCRVTH
jgi:hypothetical protein